MAAYPLIGVSGSIDAEETRHFILRDYLTAVIAAGGVPVLLSPDMEGDMLEDCLARLDGLLMAGGNDVSPALFGEPPVEALGEVNPLRDGFEMRLVRLAAARLMPVLGICRGVQAMAAALGGSLWQDLPSQYRTADGNPPIAHRQTSPGRYASHTVSVLPGTLLARLTGGAETLRVNSFHHQAVKVPGSLRVCALAPDGVIEAVEDASLPFFLGVQWHPERMYRSPQQRFWRPTCYHYTMPLRNDLKVYTTFPDLSTEKSKPPYFACRSRPAAQHGTGREPIPRRRPRASAREWHKARHSCGPDRACARRRESAPCILWPRPAPPPPARAD